MTEEEKLAEEYFKTTYPAYSGFDTFTEDIEDAVIYGLKAGGTKWHRVADGDLPKEYTEVLQENGVKVILIGGHWRYVYGAKWEDDAIVYYWCEIPTYTEEEE